MQRRSKRLGRLIGIRDIDFTNIRAARNYVEHFDERMHTFMQQPGKGIERMATIHRLITDQDLEDAVIEGKGPEPYTVRALQHLNTSTWQLNFYGLRFSIPEILALLDRVGESAENAKNKLGAGAAEA